MEKVNKTFCFAMALSLMMLVSCKKDGITAFKGNAAVNFTAQAAQYSFMVNPNSEYTQEIAVNIVGNAADHDRNFNVVVVKDSTTTAKDDQYEILKGVVKAGEFTGKLSITLKNSPALSTSKVAIKIKLADSEDFKAGNVESSVFTLEWTNKILVPSPWSYFAYYFTTKGSTAAYRIILQTTGLTKFTLAEYRVVGADGATALGTQFGDYVKQWNLEHPNDHLKHDDGALAGTEIIPLYYTHSKYD